MNLSIQTTQSSSTPQDDILIKAMNDYRNRQITDRQLLLLK